MRISDKKLSIRPSIGGVGGAHLVLMLGEEFVGHFYPDANEGIDATDILESMCQVWNEEYTI